MEARRVALKGSVLVSSLPEASMTSSGPSVAASQPLAAGSNLVAVLSGFDGSNFMTSGGYTPPDVQVAAGPNHIVEMVNLQETIYTKAGAQVKSVALDAFFIAGGDDLTDPRVYYDQANGRWFASISDATVNEVNVAVSETSDPTGAWYVYAFSSGVSSDYFADQPSLGVSSDKVVVSANMFDGQGDFVGTEIWALNSTEMLLGSDTDYADLGPDPTYFSVYPASNEGATADLYMVSVDPSVTGSFILFRVSGTPPEDVTFDNVTLPIAGFSPPNGSIQRGSNLTIDSGDGRVVSAVRSGSVLWFAFSDSAVPANDTQIQDGFRLAKVDLSSSSVVQDFDVNAAQTSYFYPAVVLDGKGDLIVLFGFSSASSYPGIMLTAQKATEAPGSYEPPVVVLAGSGPQTSLPTEGVVRYGDYFGASIDPTNSSVVWLAGQYGRSGKAGWGTHIFSASVLSQALTITASYSVSGGGSGYLAPVLHYVQGNASIAVPLTSTSQTFNVDYGSQWYVDSQLGGSSQNERWVSMQATGGTVASSVALSLTYTHQFNVSFAALVDGIAQGFGAPTVTFSSLSASSTLTLAQSFANATASYFSGWTWADSGSGYAFSNPLPGSNSTFRWEAAGPSGAVSGISTSTPSFVPQASYSVSYSTPSPAPASVSFSAAQGGIPASPVISTQPVPLWLDYGSQWSASPSVQVDTGTRLVANGTSSGIVGAGGYIVIPYKLQYLLTVVGGSAASGLVSPSTGWYDSGATISLTSNSAAGWELAGWIGVGQGSYTGAGSSASFLLSGPVTEVANFEPGLTITAEQGGSVFYAYGSMNGTVSGGSAKTVYVPANSTVSLFAMTSSILNQFAGWSGDASGSASTTVVRLTAPLAVQASFGLNLLVPSAMAAALAVVASALLLLRRRGPRPAHSQPS